MRIFYPILIVGLATVTGVKSKTTFSQTPFKSQHQRKGKFLFNIIRFRNDPCNTTKVDETGVCFTVAECASRNGVGQGSCAAGFGTCCLFAQSCYGNTEQKVSYFRNPGYPSVDTDTNYCTFGIKVKDPDVCQVRLDFESFRMSPPSITSIPFGQCSADRMAIFASQNKLGLSEGNLICGDMTGQHMYLPADASKGEDNLSLFAMVGTTSNNGVQQNYTWNIRIEQIDCLEGNERQAPFGCLQYFTDLSGSIESFNFADSTTPYPILLDYAICIKRHTGYCGLSLSANTGDYFGLNANTLTGNGLDEDCYSVNVTENISSDYIQLLGASTVDGLDVIRSAYFCGQYDATTFRPIMTSFVGPFVIRVKTDETIRTFGTGIPVTTPGDASSTVVSGTERGFRLSYAVTPNCAATN